MTTLEQQRQSLLLDMGVGILFGAALGRIDLWGFWVAMSISGLLFAALLWRRRMK